MLKKRHLLPLFLLLCSPAMACADAVWQSLFFEPGTLAHIWWVIPLGLLIEWPAVAKMTSFSWARSLGIAACMNVVSFLVGMILQVPTMSMRGVSGTITIVTVMILGSTFIEGYVINRFKKKAFNLRTFPLLLLVNAVSGGVTIAAVSHWA